MKRNALILSLNKSKKQKNNKEVSCTLLKWTFFNILNKNKHFKSSEIPSKQEIKNKNKKLLKNVQYIFFLCLKSKFVNFLYETIRTKSFKIPSPNN